MIKLFRHMPVLCALGVLLASFLYSYPDGWSDDILINADTSGDQYCPDVSTDSQNNVWITWDNATFFDGEIFYSKRDSLGNAIIPETCISNNASKSWFPLVAVDSSDKVQFVWRDVTPQGIGLWHAKLANDGSEIVLSHMAVSGAGGLTSSLRLEMAVDKYQNINIAWGETPGNDRMVYSKLDSLGDTLIAKLYITPPSVDGWGVGLGIDSSANCHLACRTDTTGTSYRLTYSKLDKDANVLIPNKVLGFGVGPSIVADKSQNIHMAFENGLGPGTRIEYMKLDQSGNILIGPDTISTASIPSNHWCDMAIDSNQFLHVVWEGYSSDNWFVMYCRLDTSGNVITPPMKIVYPPFAIGGQEPRIDVDQSNRLHVAWQGARPGDTSLNIYYKRGENEPGIEETRLIEEKADKISIYPNPFSGETKIYHSLSSEDKMPKIEIYDILGRRIREFTGDKPNGIIRWDGTDNAGNPVSAGIYFVKTNTQTFRTLNKILKLN